ncbi:hypothetical protein PsorP6_017038 [Peronosclerospora sorghi]|uniref:Uncharacterized protein n=1 Tax=Peronosclerospora sorghi TaxID=230839 RepID=A0ACC0WFZ7_9STRA|nr:hypothetical protein PsorP6_017038 [Peronosclerospora sorghi]
MPPTNQYTQLLLGGSSMMNGGDVTSCGRPEQPSQQQHYGFPCPPLVLNRQTSGPIRQLPAPHYLFQHQHQQPQQLPPSFSVEGPPTLSRQPSHGYVSTMQQPQGYQTSVSITMPPRQVHVNEMQHLLEISMDQQQPVQYQVSAPQRLIKTEPVSSSMNVEPIAFTSSDTSSKMVIDDLDPLAYAVFSNTSGPKAGIPQEIQPMESAFDSLDCLLPEIEQDILFRPHDMDQYAQASVIPKPAMKSTKSLATCKVVGCERRVRSKGFCKTHGGGRKCSIEGCKKSSQNGDFCIGHGGGKKCKEVGCAKAAQSHGLCKAHGGGARCKFPNCNKSSQGGGLCRAHGGGKRCQAVGCPKGAQRGNFCATHGGFRNCKIEGCVRTDRGGGFCEVHRRGRLCKVEGCKKLSRNQGMCTMHIREDKQFPLNLSPPIKSELMSALVV